MPPIERRYVGNAESFGTYDNRCIRRPQREIAIDRYKLGDPQPIRWMHWFDRERAGGNVAQESDLWLDA